MSNSVNIELESKTVEVEQRQLNCEWTREADEDLVEEIDAVILQEILSYDLVANHGFSNVRLKVKRTIEQLKNYYKEKYVDQHVPFTIERDDGEILLLNNDFETYSFTSNIFNNYGFRNRYYLEGLEYDDFTIKGYAPIENLFNHPEKYFTNKSQIVVNKRVKL